MAAKKFRSQFDAICADESCGAFLPKGSWIRWYRNGKVYGVLCHTKLESVQAKNGRYREEEQSVTSRPFFTNDASVAHILRGLSEGKKPKDFVVEPEIQEHFGTPCGHEDYPCCGCSNEYNARFG